MFFSIIIPTYNRSDKICRAIDSVLNQTFKDFELIVVDDCSKDDTTLILSKYKDKIKLFKNETNQGQNYSLNVGIQKSNGKVLCFLDSDDYWKSNFLEKHYEVYNNENDINVVYSEALIDKSFKTCKTFHLKGHVYKEVLKQGYLSHMISITAQKESVIKCGCFDINFVVCQDDDFCFRIAKENKIYFIDEPLAVICEDATNRTVKNMLSNAEGWERLITKFKFDIITLCGEAQFQKHCLTASLKYSLANSYWKGYDNFKLAFPRFYIFYFIYFIYNRLKVIYYYNFNLT